MGFDYNKNKGHAGQDSMWTSYSDLFLGLSIVFLLLYVTASLKQGTDGIRQQMENQKLVKESEDLKQQIKVYETLKQDYMKQAASQDEQANYKDLMDHLVLLQDEAKDERDKLNVQAKENEQKAQALNKYQQMIRNIVNSNVIAKARIKSRDTMIDQKDEVITEKSQEITGLEKTVQQKTQAIEKGEQEISTLQTKLDDRMKALQSAYQQHKMTKQKFEQQQALARQQAEQRIGALQAQNQKAQQELEAANEKAQQELAAANQNLQAVNQNLAQTSNKLNQAAGQVQKLGQEKGRLESELAQADAKQRAEANRLKGEFEAQKAKDRAAFEGELNKERLSGAAKAAREAQFKAEADAKARGLADKLSDLDKKYKGSQADLAKATENLNARRNLAAQIKKNFEKNGIKADVDGQNGDVLLSFGDQYFDTGHADLKPRMRQILEQAMPTYSASLFENDKIANKIQSVEIVGFASPTFKGKYIDPASLDAESRQAVNYNLDLSYQRARSIFNYVFDQNKMTFKNQQRMLPLVKVTGRSFLSSDKRDPATVSPNESFCKQNDCAKLQKVIIKFTLKD